MKLDRLTDFLDELLDIKSYKSDSSLNGLQVEASRTVERAAFAVDASEQSIRKAVRSGADILIVHHGLFWNVQVPVRGVLAGRLRLLLLNNLSLYAAHLPLDAHPELGNNARLAKLLGIEETEAFGEYKGVKIGVCGKILKPVSIDSMLRKITRVLPGRVQSFRFGPGLVKRVAIVSGAGSSFVEEAAEAGCDTLITGESSHASYHSAREGRVNLICAGHYATETLGVKALMDLVSERFDVKCRFIDIPTGL